MRTEHAARPPEPPIKLNQHLSPGNPRRFCLPPFEGIFAKVLKKQSCLRQNLLVVAVASAAPLQKAFVAKSAPRECDLREVSKYREYPTDPRKQISLVKSARSPESVTELPIQILPTPRSPLWHRWSRRHNKVACFTSRRRQTQGIRALSITLVTSLRKCSRGMRFAGSKPNKREEVSACSFSKCLRS